MNKLELFITEKGEKNSQEGKFIESFPVKRKLESIFYDVKLKFLFK